MSRVESFCEPEVEHLHGAIRPDFDVGRLEIAVHDPLLVRGFESVGDLFRDGQRIGERHRAARDVRGKIVAVDQLHDQRANTVLAEDSSMPKICAMFG